MCKQLWPCFELRRSPSTGARIQGVPLSLVVWCWLTLLSSVSAVYAQDSGRVSVLRRPAQTVETRQQKVRTQKVETHRVQTHKVVVEQQTDLQVLERRIKPAITRTLAATVSVQVGRGGGGYAFGSGVIISEDGFVLTAAHVSGRPNQVVRFRLHDGRTATGITLGLHKDLDAGLMKITDDGPWPFLRRARSSKMMPGDWVIGTGHPGGFEHDGPALVRLGRILKATNKVLLTDCTLVGGDSGGPLVDVNGNVVGIHSRIGADLTTNLHVPVDRFAEHWDRLAKGDVWGHLVNHRPWIGIEHSKQFDQAHVKEVRSNSPAERAGLRSGDTVVRFGGIDVDSFTTLRRLVSQRDPGEQVAIEYKRDNVLIEATMDIGQRDVVREDSQTRDDADLLKDWLDQIDRHGRAIVGIGKNSEQVKGAFHDALEKASNATVEIYDRGNIVALGTIVDRHLILSKASQLHSKHLLCRFRASRSFRVRKVAELREYDLVLLRSERPLPAANLVAARTPAPGTLIASSGLNVWPLAVGVISSPEVDVLSEAKLGIVMNHDQPIISNLVANSGAEIAGLQIDDKITAVNHHEVQESEDLIRVVSAHYPGETLHLEVLRQGQPVEIDVELGRFSEFDQALAEFKGFIGGKLSQRRTGFANVLQHDTAIRPRHCGGPVIDSHGRFVGINIARAARTTSYLLPAKEVKVALQRLKAKRTDTVETNGSPAAGAR